MSKRRPSDYVHAAKALYGLPCHWCGKPADTADHVPPLCAFPSADLWDGELVPACRSCNSSRGASDGNRLRRSTRLATQW